MTSQKISFAKLRLLSIIFFHPCQKKKRIAICLSKSRGEISSSIVSAQVTHAQVLAHYVAKYITANLKPAL